jgi:type I restriction enzyme M protein
LHNKAFEDYAKTVSVVTNTWKEKNIKQLMAIGPDTHAKLLINDIGESLLSEFFPVPLIDGYDMYQHLMNYRGEIMQDDVYLIIEN